MNAAQRYIIKILREQLDLYEQGLNRFDPEELEQHLMLLGFTNHADVIGDMNLFFEHLNDITEIKN